jgi:hypothetical protein
LVLLALFVFVNTPGTARAGFPDEVCTWSDGDPLPVPGTSITATCTFPFWGVQQSFVVRIANVMDYDAGIVHPFVLSCRLNGNLVEGPGCTSYYGNWTPIFKLMLGEYASKDAACSADPMTQLGDPITVILRMVGDPASHLYEHGLPAIVQDDPFETIAEWAGEPPYDYFYDNGDCVQSEIMRGSNVSHEACWRIWNYVPILAECLRSRWHVRGHLASLPDPEYPTLLRDYALTPHYDKATTLCGDQAPPAVFKKHLVEEDFFHNGRNYSGYSRARDWVANQWLSSGHHWVMDWQFWGNREPRLQCNGEQPRSDGWVFMIGTCGEGISPNGWC